MKLLQKNQSGGTQNEQKSIHFPRRRLRRHRRPHSSRPSPPRRIDIKTVSIKETKQIQTSHGITMLTDTTFAETDFADADMLVLPGGMPGTKYLAGYKPLTDLLTDFNSKGKKSPLSVLHQVYSQVLDFSETAKPPLIRPL